MPDVATSLDLVGKLADALDKVGAVIESSLRRGYRGYDFVTRERERRRYVDILHNFTRMRQTQGIFLGSLQYYLSNPGQADWKYMAQSLEALTPVVEDLFDTLGRERGEIVLQERQAFADLGSALQGRKQILDWLAALKPPISQAQVVSLEALVQEYRRLIETSERAASAIERYAASLER